MQVPYTLPAHGLSNWVVTSVFPWSSMVDYGFQMTVIILPTPQLFLPCDCHNSLSRQRVTLRLLAWSFRGDGAPRDSLGTLAFGVLGWCKNGMTALIHQAHPEWTLGGVLRVQEGGQGES